MTQWLKESQDKLMVSYFHDSTNGRKCAKKLARLFSVGTGLLFGFDTVVQAVNLPANEELFVANGNNDTIESFNSAGTGSVFASSGLSGPYGLAFDSAGNLYVANSYVGYTGYSIVKISASGVGTVFAGPSTGLSEPAELAFDSKGNLYVANAGNDTIEKFNSSGVGTVFANTGLNFPTALAFNSTGNLFVANGNGFNIEEFNSSGVGTVFASQGVSSPTGMAFNSQGTLFVANQNGIIEEFNSSGANSVFARLPVGETAVDVAFDSAGDLFATTSYNTVEEFNSSGVGTVFASTGLDVPNGLAFQTVPESPSWAHAAGILGALLAIRRCRASVVNVAAT